MTTAAITSVPAGTRIAIREPGYLDGAGGVVMVRKEYVVRSVEPVTAEAIRFARATSGYDYTGCVKVRLVDARVADLMTARGKALPNGKTLVWAPFYSVEVVA